MPIFVFFKLNLIPNFNSKFFDFFFYVGFLQARNVKFQANNINLPTDNKLFETNALHVLLIKFESIFLIFSLSRFFTC